jgi:hypothetical protein
MNTHLYVAGVRYEKKSYSRLAFLSGLSEDTDNLESTVTMVSFVICWLT